MIIYFLPTSYPDIDHPVKNTFIYEQAKMLADRGHKIIVLHVQKQPSKYIFKILDKTIYRNDDGFAIRYSIQQKTFLEERLPLLNKYLFKRSMKKLYKFAIMDGKKPDVLYAHFSCWAGSVGVDISKQFGIPLVVIEHYSGFMGNKINPILKHELKRTVSNSNAFICVSESLKDNIYRHTKTKRQIYTVSNIVDDRFQYYAPSANKDKFVFCSVGRLHAIKRFQILIKAFCKEFDENEPVCLRIGGGGEAYSQLKRLIENHNRENQILLKGPLTREETLQEYILCDSFVLVSKAETFGIVYREAMAVGRPIITTDNGGFSNDEWDDGNGIRVSVDDINAIADALRKMYQEHARYNGEEISRKCLKICSASVIGAKLEGIFKKVSKVQSI